MDTANPVPLDARLLAVAQLWSAACESSLARLGRLVVNDGGFFARIEKPEASTTTATLAKFARFLADPANWPEGPDGERIVAAEAVALAHVVGVTPAPAAPSAGLSGEMSGQRSAAA